MGYWSRRTSANNFFWLSSYERGVASRRVVKSYGMNSTGFLIKEKNVSNFFLKTISDCWEEWFGMNPTGFTYKEEIKVLTFFSPNFRFTFLILHLTSQLSVCILPENRCFHQIGACRTVSSLQLWSGLKWLYSIHLKWFQ